ncbi:MAG: LacI family DNA-binding transcriptional regulator [Clostridiales bacterium]|nr:LacI family DNA-binding transcriptional regulator [Clostridiales bacterium]
MKIYTIKDIAQRAGVSVTTVSRVLNKRPDVNQATREKVERVMAECHFTGNANARGLKQTDGETVAIILRGRENPFLNALAEAVLRYTHDLDASFLVEYVDEKADEFQTAVRLSHEKRVKGCIFLGGRIDERAYVLQGLDMPMVFATISAENANLPWAGSVFIDDRAMGFAVMQTLLNAGHTRIAIFGGKRQGDDGFGLRYKGAMDALAAANIPFDEDRYVDTRFSLRGAYDTARGFFAIKPDTTAVFAMSDTVAMGVIRALQDIGRRVPQDVSVVGYDGIEMGKYFIPRLTTVAQPVNELARESVAMLMGMLEHGEEPRHIAVDAQLIVRESVGKISQ